MICCGLLIILIGSSLLTPFGILLVGGNIGGREAPPPLLALPSLLLVGALSGIRGMLQFGSFAAMICAFNPPLPPRFAAGDGDNDLVRDLLDGEEEEDREDPDKPNSIFEKLPLPFVGGGGGGSVCSDDPVESVEA